MELFITVCNDRHTDLVIRVFDTAEKAINYAKKFVKEIARHQEEIDESEIDGWLYHCTYGCEDDYVCVEKATLNDES